MRILTCILLMIGLASAVPAATDAFQRAATDARAVLQAVERAQAAYRARHGRYTASLQALRIERTRGVDVRIVAEGAAGYSAVAIADAEECAVYHGRARPPRHWVRTPARITCRSS
jgi:type II secretory pathway pseudopilin PulG